MTNKWANVLAGILAIKSYWIAVMVFFVIVGTSFDYQTYWGSTSDTVTVAWDPSDVATRYEYEAYHVERSMALVTGSTALTQVTIGLPSAGHYVMRVRACKDPVKCDEADGTGSVWIESTDPAVAQVDGKPKGWWIYRFLAAASEFESGP